MEEHVRIAKLVVKSLRNELDQPEAEELATWKKQSAENAAFVDRVISDDQLQQGLIDFDAEMDTVWNKITNAVAMEIPVVTMPERKTTRWSTWVAAASVTVAVAVGGYYWLRSDNTKPVAKVEDQQSRFKNDIAPGQNKAVLTLSDGRKIVLDNAAPGRLEEQGGSVVRNENGELVYQADNKKGEVLYNTLSTVRGETYQVTLADGSKVWLNSASSIRYPVSFTGDERLVEISGEAYFEVKRNPKKPFRVSILPAGSGPDGYRDSKHAVVEVLGTHFNVMAYQDENSINTTLLEGSVKFIKDGKADLLKPGQQVQLKNSGERKLVSEVDTEEVTAWKNGNFQFNGATIEEIMRQVRRWYDVEIIFEGVVVKEPFVTSIPRSMPVSKLLKVLELTDMVHFRIEGNKIFVTR